MRKTSAFVRRYINHLKVGQLFETFDLLAYGSRSTVDFVLKEMVRKDQIVRLSRGIYMRGDSTITLPRPEEVAAFKANSLGAALHFFEEESDGERPQLTTESERKLKECRYRVEGAGSSFEYGDYRIVLKPISQAKLRKLRRQKEAEAAAKVEAKARS